jgi:hypothetical protein
MTRESESECECECERTPCACAPSLSRGCARRRCGTWRRRRTRPSRATCSAGCGARRVSASAAAARAHNRKTRPGQRRQRSLVSPRPHARSAAASAPHAPQLQRVLLLRHRRRPRAPVRGVNHKAEAVQIRPRRRRRVVRVHLLVPRLRHRRLERPLRGAQTHTARRRARVGRASARAKRAQCALRTNAPPARFSLRASRRRWRSVRR